MTVNKIQGQSLWRCGVSIPTSVFTHGQLYVVTSQVIDPLYLCIFANENEFQLRRGDAHGARWVTRNVVYSEII